MTFAAPWWLLLVFPLGALAWWLMRVLPIRRTVPFIELWRDVNVLSRRSDQRLVRPPMWIVFALLAAFSAVVAASGPELTFLKRGVVISVIVDRGVTMSARGNYANSLALAQHELRAHFGSPTAELTLVPGDVRRTEDDWFAAAERHPPTALDTSSLLVDAVRAELRETEHPVIVITNQPVEIDNRRLIVISPTTRPSNVGIVSLAARIAPIPSVMVAVRNQSTLSRATLAVTSSGQTLSREIGLPASEQVQSYFVEVAALDDVVTVTLDVADDLAADNRASLLRGVAWPRVEAGGALPAELIRMIDVYSRARKPSQSSSQVVVTDGLFKLGDKTAGAAVFSGASALARRAVGQRIQVHDHPIVEGIDWSKIVSDARVLGSPGDGWTAIMLAGESVFVAVREKPARQVWVGFHSPAFASLPEFVMFWTKVFDWLGRSGNGEYESQAVRQLSNAWVRLGPASGDRLTADPTTGVFQTADGRLLTQNALDVRLASPATSPADNDRNDHTARNDPALIGHAGRVGLSLRAPLAGACLVLIALAMLTMPATLRKPATTMKA